MKISIIIPAYNEEETIGACLKSCLNQTRKADHIIVVNDGSTDRTGKIIDSFGKKVNGIHLTKNTGNKSHVQQIAINHVTDDVFIATDADTILDKHFVEQIEKSFNNAKHTVAVCGYVISMKGNWVTGCRELEYIVGQDVHKRAQAIINSILVMPGCATGFKTDFFKKHVTFDHDTIAEDLDFSYKINNYKKTRHILFNNKAIVYTQDPDTLGAYIHQLKRWQGGGWQCLKKHFGDVNKFFFIFELSLAYIEGLVFSIMVFVIPFVNLKMYFHGLILFYTYTTILGIYGAIRRKRIDLFFYSFFIIIFSYINSYVFITEFYKQIIKNNKSLIWFKPERRNINF
ncbi:MAG: glycosyltransferase family 2 protein [Candidatus Gracilibacteria bacterium]|nr:glycosyltransferase family 2 protein [Candidatus Gracilibacteria bacterium]